VACEKSVTTKIKDDILAIDKKILLDHADSPQMIYTMKQWEQMMESGIRVHAKDKAWMDEIPFYEDFAQDIKHWTDHTHLDHLAEPVTKAEADAEWEIVKN
jgi:hypothetical protein